MQNPRRLRILIVDDSAVMRSLLRSVVAADPSLEVAGTAADGQSALGMIEGLCPDLILLDVEMPLMDGLETLRNLRARGHKMPIIMCSALTLRGAHVTIEALAAGASDYVAKPAGHPGRESALHALAQDLLPRIHALAATAQLNSPDSCSSWQPAEQPAPRKPQPAHAPPSVLVIGVSTGGPAALDGLLPALPHTFPIPTLIVQHMPAIFTQLLAERLDRICSLRVREAAEGEMVRPGSIHIARGNWHLQVLAPARAGLSASLHLTQAPAENHCRPSVDVLFRSAAAVYGAGVLAVQLTGMGSDGLAGCRLIRALGGTVLAQDQATSAVWGMPGVVARAGLAHKVLPLHAIAPEIVRLTDSGCGQVSALQPSVAL